MPKKLTSKQATEKIVNLGIELHKSGFPCLLAIAFQTPDDIIGKTLNIESFASGPSDQVLIIIESCLDKYETMLNTPATPKYQA